MRSSAGTPAGDAVQVAHTLKLCEGLYLGKPLGPGHKLGVWQVVMQHEVDTSNGTSQVEATGLELDPKLQCFPSRANDKDGVRARIYSA